MKYRADLDGLRAIAVLSVIILHSGFSFLSGGYVGVDVFFVISGYLITTIVFNEVKSQTFTFAKFYKRRIGRLLPALSITLLVTLLFGFFFYDTKSFDNLGQEIFFSAIGAANILFAEGINYFANDESTRPLIHLWSLGVEEQFYLVWPVLLIFLSSFRLRYVLLITLSLFIISLRISTVTLESAPMEAYFYTHNRAFELLMGAIVALLLQDSSRELNVSTRTRELLSILGISLIIVPMFVLNKNSSFPGINALYPCIGTALLIAFADQSLVSKALSLKPLVFIGLISYPLYMYHQPILSFLHFFELDYSNIFVLFVIVFVTFPLAWLTYRYVEKPTRNLARKKDNLSFKLVLGSLVTSLFCFAFVGLWTAKSGGATWRFKVLNPFAYEVVQQNLSTFHTSFKRGFKVAEADEGKVLFIGDSVLQQYVYPMSKILDIEETDVDTVTRGGCVLLKLKRGYLRPL